MVLLINAKFDEKTGTVNLRTYGEFHWSILNLRGRGLPAPIRAVHIFSTEYTHGYMTLGIIRNLKADASLDIGWKAEEWVRHGLMTQSKNLGKNMVVHTHGV